MKFFHFEMGKLWRQKKFLWLFIIVFLCIGGIFLYNFSQQSLKGERALGQVDFYANTTDELYADLNALYRENALDELQEKQYEYTNNMATALFHWKSSIYKKKWSEIPSYEMDFLTNLQAFEKVEGEFLPLQGIEREKTIQKNNWLHAHNLSYEDEKYPVSPALILKESAGVLYGSVGILILLLFFGNTITVEKEHQTWSTLRTQPIAKWKLVVAKYATLLVTLVIFLIVVVGLGLIIPLIFSGYSMNLQYPLILTSGDTFILISTAEYLTRGIVLFICAGTFAFSLIFLLSTWVKNSFSALMITGFILFLGFFATDVFVPLQFSWNPFHLLQFSKVLAKIPQSTDWLYPFATIMWSVLLVTLSIYLPERELRFFGSPENNKPFRRGETKKSIYAVWNINMLEWRKMRRNGLLKQIYLILSLLIVFGYFVIAEQSKEKEAVYLEELITLTEQNIKEAIPIIENIIVRFEEERKLAEEADDDDEYLIEMYSQQIEELENEIASFGDDLDEKKAAVDLYENNDWIAFQNYQLGQNEQLKANYEIAEGPKTISQFTIEASIAEKKWLMEHNIQPVFGGEYIPTIHDNWGDEHIWEKEWEETNRKVDNSGLFSLYLYFDKYFYLIPMMLFLFLLGAGFSNEKGKKATLQFLRTQPIDEKRIFLGKSISSTVMGLVSGISLFVFVILVSTVFNRFGDWDYPVLRYVSKRFMDTTEYTGIRTFDGGGHFIPLGSYLLEGVYLFLCVTLFLISLSIFLSLFFKSQMGLFTTTILIGVVGYVGSSTMLSEKAQLSPFTYMNIPKIINGEISALVNNPSINVQTGSLVLLASTLLLFVIGYFLLGLKNKVRK